MTTLECIYSSQNYIHVSSVLIFPSVSFQVFSLISSEGIKGLDSADCGVFHICISLSKQKVSNLKKAADHMKYWSSSLRTKEIGKKKNQNQNPTAKPPGTHRHEEVKVYPNERCKAEHARSGKVISAKLTTSFKEDVMYA